MAIAFVSKDVDPDKYWENGSKEGWLTMNEADALVCELFNEPVDPKFYCNGWFDQFSYFDWRRVKKTYHFGSDYTYEFSTAEHAIIHYFKCLLSYYDSGDDIWEDVEKNKQYVQKHIEPIIRMFYDKGYKIVSLNIG